MTQQSCDGTVTDTFTDLPEIYCAGFWCFSSSDVYWSFITLHVFVDLFSKCNQHPCLFP